MAQLHHGHWARVASSLVSCLNPCSALAPSWDGKQDASCQGRDQAWHRSPIPKQAQNGTLGGQGGALGSKRGVEACRGPCRQLGLHPFLGILAAALGRMRGVRGAGEYLVFLLR